MEWHEGRPKLMLTGHRSAEEVVDIFASAMVDVAGVDEVVGDTIFVAADDPSWPVDAADFEWLCGVIRDTLASYGITSVELSFVPVPTVDRAESP